MKDSKKKLMNELALKRVEYFCLQDKYNDLKNKYDRVKEHSDYLEKYCDSLSGHCNCCQAKLETNYQTYINQMEDKIASLIAQRDSWKADCEYNAQCFQAEREARHKLEDEIKVLKGQITYPCILLNCNNSTGESSSLYVCFSYDDKVLLANNVPKHINKENFIINADCSKGSLIYEVEYLLPQFVGDERPYDTCAVKFEVSYDLKKVISSCMPKSWNTCCHHKDVRDNHFQKYCFLSSNDRLYVRVSTDRLILLDAHPEIWVQKSYRWKILCDDNNTKNSVVQIYDEASLKSVTYYIEDDRVKKVISEQIVE